VPAETWLDDILDAAIMAEVGVPLENLARASGILLLAPSSGDDISLAGIARGPSSFRSTSDDGQAIYPRLRFGL
jgi:hypothetical protein